MIKNGGFPLNVYKILFDSSVCSITDYGSEVWGFKDYEPTKKVQLKACRAYLGVPKNTPIPGLLSEINWNKPRLRTQIQMIRYFHRLLIDETIKAHRSSFCSNRGFLYLIKTSLSQFLLMKIIKV